MEELDTSAATVSDTLCPLLFLNTWHLKNKSVSWINLQRSQMQNFLSCLPLTLFHHSAPRDKDLAWTLITQISVTKTLDLNFPNSGPHEKVLKEHASDVRAAVTETLIL